MTAEVLCVLLSSLNGSGIRLWNKPLMAALLFLYTEQTLWWCEFSVYPDTSLFNLLRLEV